MTLNLLLFAITFTIFLEIEFDFIFYVPYRSEEISPPGDRAVTLRVKELEDPVHQDVVGHVEGVVEKLAERVSVHCVQLDGIVPRIYRKPVTPIGAK